MGRTGGDAGAPRGRFETPHVVSYMEVIHGVWSSGGGSSGESSFGM